MTLTNRKSKTVLKGLAASMVALLCLGCSKAPTTGATSTPAAGGSTPAAAATTAATPAAAETPSANAGDWVKCEIAEGTITLMAPEELKANDTGDNTVVYATTDEAYAVIVTHGDEMNEDPAAALKMLKDMVIKEAGAEETHAEEIEFKGAPAMRFGMKAKDENGNEVPVEMMTTFVGGDTLVQVAVTNADHEKFFSTIEFVAAEDGGGDEGGDAEEEGGDAEESDEG